MNYYDTNKHAGMTSNCKLADLGGWREEKQENSKSIDSPESVDNSLAEDTVEQNRQDSTESNADIPVLTTRLDLSAQGRPLNDSLALSAVHEFNQALADCGGAIAASASMFSGRCFMIASCPRQTIEFLGLESGTAIIREFSAGEYLNLAEMKWRIVDGRLVVDGVDEDGIAYRETIAVVALDDKQPLKMSLKGLVEEANTNQVAAFLGEIWGDMLIEQQP